jgi:hypothetical protein
MTEHDDDLHDPRLTALYQRKDGERPPARADALIRKAAHAAVKKPAARRLWPSLATAAILVLGVSVALKVFEQPDLQSLDRAPVEASRESRARVEQDRLEQTAPAQTKVVPRRDGAAALEPAPAPARSQFAPSAKRKMESESRPAMPSSSFLGRAEAPRVESGRSDEPGMPMHDGMAVDMQADGVDSPLSEARSELDCSVYGNRLELTEEERRRRLVEFQRRRDEAGIRCLERAREGLQPPGDRGR